MLRHSLPIIAFLLERIELPYDYHVRIIFHACIRLISGLNDKDFIAFINERLKKQIVVKAEKKDEGTG